MSETKQLTVKEVSERLAVTEFTVRQYIKSGKLKATKQPKGLKFYYLISEYDLQIFIAENIDNQ